MHLDFSVCVEGLSTEEINDVLERVSSEWKAVSQQLEDLGRKVQLQEDISAYFKQLDALEKTIKAKEEWLRGTPFSESPQQPLPSLKDSCQVGCQTAGLYSLSVLSLIYKEDTSFNVCSEDVCMCAHTCARLCL